MDIFKMLRWGIGLLLVISVFLVVVVSIQKMREPVSRASAKESLNGFDLTRHSIPPGEIISGGPPKDGIPALTDPDFIKGDQADYLRKEDRVLGVALGGEAKAYPIKILNWHEIVNDSIAGQPVVITYCPLCGTGMGFDPVVAGERLTFGVSGLLYNSDVLMYDRQTSSLWSQIKQEAVAGPLLGSRLQLLDLLHTTWEGWRSQYPSTRVLSNRTGYFRIYENDPYKEYAATSRLMFPVGNHNADLQPKEWVLGVEMNGEARVYPFSILMAQPAEFKDSIGKMPITVHFDSDTQSAYITDRTGKRIPSVVGYWFAWYAFYPHTSIYRRNGLSDE